MRANIVTETEENFALTYEKEDLDCNWVDVDYRFCFSKFLFFSLGKIFEIEDAKNLLKEEKMIIPFIITRMKDWLLFGIKFNFHIMRLIKS